MENIYVWKEGEIHPAHEASVPVLDRGFLFGESVYETFRTYDGYPFLFLEHYDRLIQSTQSLAIPFQYSSEALWKACRDLSGRFEDELYLRIMVTGGVSDIVLEPDSERRPSVLIFAKPFAPYPPSFFTEGVEVAIVETRRNPTFSLNPRIKSCNLLNNILAFREAKARGGIEAIMLNYEGWVAEGASSNIFIVDRQGVIRTPDLRVGILEGVTRRFILWLCDRFDISVEEAYLKKEDIYEAKECFITSSLKGVMPVTRVDGQLIGDGRPGPITVQLMGWYDTTIIDYVERCRAMGNMPVRWLPRLVGETP